MCYSRFVGACRTNVMNRVPIKYLSEEWKKNNIKNLNVFVRFKIVKHSNIQHFYITPLIFMQIDIEICFHAKKFDFVLYENASLMNL